MKSEKMAQLNDSLKKMLKKQHYALVGNHSAVKVCHWTKESILRDRVCYKQKFYGVQSHRCLQMTPTVGYCNHNCVFCWRPVENTVDTKMEQPFDEPAQIIDNAIVAQKKLLIGYKGHPDGINMKKLEEAFKPTNCAISLSGEPTLYPALSEMIDELHRRNITTFLVSNGTMGFDLDPLPKQLYLSIDAPDEDTYKRVDRPTEDASWKKIMNSVELFPSLSTRRVIRLTLMRTFNMHNVQGYAGILKKAQPDFVECKAYMHVGYSRLRVDRSEMPTHAEVKDFAQKIADASGYEITDESSDSRVVLLK